MGDGADLARDREDALEWAHVHGDCDPLTCPHHRDFRPEVLVTTGGQTGVDQAALRAARRAGLKTGGWAARGWATEDGPAPWLAEYGLKPHAAGYKARTRANVAEASAVLLLGDPTTPGSLCTLSGAHLRALPVLVVTPGVTPRQAAEWFFAHCDPTTERITLMVGGNRESLWPGIGARAERFLATFFKVVRAALG